MARPFQTPYEPEFETLSSPSTGGPITPYARRDAPISFKTNVNRAKTKRWVEAKKYSYDGNDWGDDEYDEYDDEPPTVPQGSNLSQSTNDLSNVAPRSSCRPPLPSMDRSLSMDHVATFGVGPAGNASTASATPDKPHPFMRPADIYKRMQERGRQSSDSHPYGNAPHLARSQTEPVSQTPLPATDDHELHLSSGANIRGHEHASGSMEGSNVPPSAVHDTPSPELRDVKPLSGSNTDFLPSENSAKPQNASADLEQSPQLQHNQSFGFRSVVHQAFDVPETPSTTVDSVARSNSDSTSAISPIIGSQSFNEEKTPTIVEEPGEISTPKEANDQSLVFKPGHRRDMSLPSPDNSPLRKPIINPLEPTASSVLAEMSSETPTDSSSSFYHPLPHRASVQLPSTGDLPAPLNIGSNQTADPPLQHNEEVPVIMSSTSTENSPQDTENDRLREEIILSLSRENTPGAETEQQDQASRPQASRQDTEVSRQDSLIPSEYERYWSQQTESSPQDLRPPVLGYSPAENTSQDLYSSSPMITPAPAPAAQPNPRPKLKRRFSWESSSSEEEIPPVDLQSVSPSAVPIPGHFPVAHESTTELAPATVPEEQEIPVDRDQPIDRQHTPEKPKLTIVPPAPMDDSIIVSDGHLPEVVNRQSTEMSRSPVPGARAPPSVEPTLLGFRDILGIQSSAERVRAFDRTRDQFATIDTGLKNWLQVVVRAHPEHMDVVEKSIKASSMEPKTVVSKGKFPKLSSLGHFASHQDGPPSGSGHTRRPSAPLGAIMNKQQVEQRGKDLLHTAGALGGRAGEAAKGLFAKGRNKLKGGGSDKGFHRVRGYRREIQLADFASLSAIDSTKPGGHPNQRHTIHFGSFPGVKTGVSSTLKPFRLDVEPQPSIREGRLRADGINMMTLHASKESKPSNCMVRKALPDDTTVSLSNPRNDDRGNQNGPSGSESHLINQSELSSIVSKTKIILESRKVDNKRRAPNEPVGECEDCGKKAEQATAKPRKLGEDEKIKKHADINANKTQTCVGIENDAKMSPAEAPPPTGALLLDWRDLQPRIPSVSSLGAQEAYLDPQPSSDLGLGRPSEINLTGQNPDPGSMLNPANPPSSQSVNPALPRRWYARPTQARGDEAESTHSRSRGLSRSSVSPGRPATPGVSHGSHSPRTGSNAAASQDDMLFSDLAARGSPPKPTVPSPKSKSAMEKMKIFRCNRGASSDEADSKADRSRRGTFDRLGGWFGRSRDQQSRKPAGHGTTASESSVAQTMEWLRPVSSQPTPGHSRFYSDDQTDRGRSMENDMSFQGQRPPPEGYFAPESFSRFRRSPRPSKSIQNLPARVSPDHEPDRLPSPAGSLTYSGRISPHPPHHQQQPQPLTPNQLSPHPSPGIPRTPPSRGRSIDRAYTQDLHLRSRSPKTFPPRPEERSFPSTDTSDPAHNLGTFRSNPRTSRIGDQELPWKLTLPDSDDENLSLSLSHQPGPSGPSGTRAWMENTTKRVLLSSQLPTYVEDSEVHGQPPPPVPDEKEGECSRHPHRGEARVINPNDAVELPVQADDDSGEEITMSSTAYPGQEWRPLGLSGWEF